MKRLSKKQIEKREALRNEFLPEDAWTLTLNGNIKDYDKSLNGLLYLQRTLSLDENADLLDGTIPPHYVELANRFARLTTILREAFKHE